MRRYIDTIRATLGIYIHGRAQPKIMDGRGEGSMSLVQYTQ